MTTVHIITRKNIMKHFHNNIFLDSFVEFLIPVIVLWACRWGGGDIKINIICNLYIEVLNVLEEREMKKKCVEVMSILLLFNCKSYNLSVHKVNQFLDDIFQVSSNSVLAFLQPLRDETLCMVRINNSTGILEITSWILVFNSCIVVDHPWFIMYFAFKVTPQEVIIWQQIREFGMWSNKRSTAAIDIWA